MIDIVFPEQNEEEFIGMADRLGYDSICFFYSNIKAAYLKHIENLRKKTGIKIYTASSVSGKPRPDIVIVKTTDPRQWIEGGKTDAVYGLESSRQRDSHKQRKSGLNHVLCSIAQSKKKIICFDFSSLLSSSGPRKAELIGRMMQNIRLCRKYKVETAIGSFAREPLDMRSPSDLKAFFSVLGMEDRTAKESLEAVRKRAELNIKKKQGDYIAEGVERI